MPTHKKKKKKNIIDYKAGGKLGKRAVLDANKDGKLTAEDFRLLRERKKSEKKVPKAAVGMSLLAIKGLSAALPALKAAAAKKAAAAAAKKAVVGIGKKVLTNVAVNQGTKAINEAMSPNLTGTGEDLRNVEQEPQVEMTEPMMSVEQEEEAPMVEDLVPSMMRKAGGKMPAKSKISKKIKKLMDEGYSQKQAVAIALSMMKKNKREMGGKMDFMVFVKK
jgi:uncharacterized protein YoaH (UPF0181 family)